MAYYSKLTTAGLAAQATAIANATVMQLTTISVGDANGNHYDPTGNETALINTKYTAGINTLTKDPNDPTRLIASLVIPPEIGGFYIRELGLYDSTGVLVAIANVPETYKPLLAEGSGKTLTVSVHVAFSSELAVALSIDATTVYATREYADTQDVALLQAAKDFTTTAIASLVASSPDALNTLNELAAALGNDANFATTITNALALKAPKESPIFTGTPQAPSAMGLNTQQIATAKDIYRYVNAYRGVIGSVAAALTLDETNYNGRYIYYSGTANAVWTLANFTTYTHSRLTIENQSSYQLKLTAASGYISDGLNSSAAFIWLSPGDIATLHCDGTNWTVLEYRSQPGLQRRGVFTFNASTTTDDYHLGCMAYLTAPQSVITLHTPTTRKQCFLDMKNISGNYVTLTYANKIHQSGVAFTTIYLLTNDQIRLRFEPSWNQWIVEYVWGGRHSAITGQYVSRGGDGCFIYHGRATTDGAGRAVISHQVPMQSVKLSAVCAAYNSNYAGYLVANYDDVGDTTPLLTTPFNIWANGAKVPGFHFSYHIVGI